MTQWNHILIITDWREFSSCWTWVASIPKGFSSCIPALKVVQMLFLLSSAFMDPWCSRCVLDGMFIVWRFHSLVDYLTSFSGVHLSSLMFPWRCSLSSAKLTSWCSNSFISGRHVCTNWTATFESQFLFLYSLLYFKSSNVYFLHLFFFNYLQHKLKKTCYF